MVLTKFWLCPLSVLVLTTSACGGSSSGASSAPTVTATVSVTAEPSQSDESPIGNGKRLRLKDTADVGFATITPLEVDSDVPVDNFPGQERWAAVLVRTCATADEADGEPIEVSWAPWTVGDADDGTYQVTGVTGGISYPLPTYPLDVPKRLLTGDCVKGWIPFNVAPGAKLTPVTYASDRIDEPVTWTY